MPAHLQALGQAYLQAVQALEANPADKSAAMQVDQHVKAVRSELASWLSTLPPEQIHHLWQQMHDLDVYGGWGKADITALAPATGTAQIRLLQSFVARFVPYWQQLAAESQGQLFPHVCSFFEGYFLGEARIMFGREDLECIETSCLADGSPECHFIIEPERSISV
jgi:hypothetical protein